MKYHTTLVGRFVQTMFDRQFNEALDRHLTTEPSWRQDTEEDDREDPDDEYWEEDDFDDAYYQPE